MDTKHVVPIMLRVGKLFLAYFMEPNSCSYWIVQCGAINPAVCGLWTWDAARKDLSHSQPFGLETLPSQHLEAGSLILFYFLFLNFPS